MQWGKALNNIDAKAVKYRAKFRVVEAKYL